MIYFTKSLFNSRKIRLCNGFLIVTPLPTNQAQQPGFLSR